jgi:hypothetical protein
MYHTGPGRCSGRSSDRFRSNAETHPAQGLDDQISATLEERQETERRKPSNAKRPPKLKIRLPQPCRPLGATLTAPSTSARMICNGRGLADRLLSPILNGKLTTLELEQISKSSTVALSPQSLVRGRSQIARRRPVRSRADTEPEKISSRPYGGVGEPSAAQGDDHGTKI